MKKKNVFVTGGGGALVVLLAFCMAFAFVGCDETGPCDNCGENPCECEAQSTASLSDEAKADLKKMDIYPGKIIVPQGTTFSGYAYFDTTKTIFIFWKDADQTKFDAYKAAWESKPKVTKAAVADAVGDHTPFGTCNIEFLADAGKCESSGFQYEAGSIRLMGVKYVKPEVGPDGDGDDDGGDDGADD